MGTYSPCRLTEGKQFQIFSLCRRSPTTKLRPAHSLPNASESVLLACRFCVSRTGMSSSRYYTMLVWSSCISIGIGEIATLVCYVSIAQGSPTASLISCGLGMPPPVDFWSLFGDNRTVYPAAGWTNLCRGQIKIRGMPNSRPSALVQ